MEQIVPFQVLQLLFRSKAGLKRASRYYKLSNATPFAARAPDRLNHLIMFSAH